MSRFTIQVFIVALCVVTARPAAADFLVGYSTYFSVRTPASWIVHNDGSIAVLPSSGPAFAHESYDTFILSADGQRFYAFANDLGSITTESWSAVSGAYMGAVSQTFPLQGQPWPNGFRPGYAIGEVHTRSTYPAFGGDLLFVSPLGVDQNGFCCSNKPLIHVINTGSHQLVEQIIPPSSVTAIYDFTMGPGTLGPKSRAYANTEDGMFVFNEAPPQIIGFDFNTFQPIYGPGRFELVSATPLLTTLSSTASFDIGPTDGYLYVLDGTGSASSIKRYDTSNGALIDTFLTFGQYNYGGGQGRNLKFGPDGGLYFATLLYDGNYHYIVSRFNVSTGQRTNDYVLGSGIYSDFHVLPVPEPATSILLLVGLMLLATRHRVC